MNTIETNIELIKSITDEHIQEYLNVILKDAYNDWKEITSSPD